MNTKSASLRNAKGSVLVMTALVITLLMGMAGLAIDMSHAYVNKTRLQNLADSLALSAAIYLNKQNDPNTKTDEIAAENYAKDTTFDLFRAGNPEINNSLAKTNLIFTFAKIPADLSASVSGDWKLTADISPGDPQNAANFVRVFIQPMNVPTWFASVIGFNNLTVNNSAVAGLTPITPCDIAPLMMCADMESANPPVVKDKNCGDNTNDKGINGNPGVDKDCYGYELNALYCMKSETGGTPDPLCPDPPSSFGPGNFGWLNLDPPGLNPSLKYCTAGDEACKANCQFSNDPNTNLPLLPPKTGEVFGQAYQGFATRFAIYGAGLSPDFYRPDWIIGGNTIGNLNDVQRIGSENKLIPLYNNYVTALTGSTDVPSAYSIYPRKDEHRRILPIPFVNCGTATNPISLNGTSGNVQVVGFGCFLMAREYGNVSNPYVYGDKDASKKYLYGVFLGDDANICTGVGVETSSVDFGYDKVILYKDPLTGLGGHS